MPGPSGTVTELVWTCSPRAQVSCTENYIGMWWTEVHTLALRMPDARWCLIKAQNDHVPCSALELDFATRPLIAWQSLNLKWGVLQQHRADSKGGIFFPPESWPQVKWRFWADYAGQINGNIFIPFPSKIKWVSPSEGIELAITGRQSRYWSERRVPVLL
eukprot:scaffold345109_cov15-Prasinocladus_malaysianus.AAC.1